jgi:hypothetical protein
MTDCPGSNVPAFLIRIQNYETGVGKNLYLGMPTHKEEFFK